MTDHQGKRHYELAEKLIGEHFGTPCFDAEVRCDHERAAVHAQLATAHALASIAGSLEALTHQVALLLMEPVPAEMGQVLTLAPDPEPELVFHGPDCPGHTTGLPGESCIAATSPAETDSQSDDDTAWHPSDHRYAPDEVADPHHDPDAAWAAGDDNPRRLAPSHPEYLS